MTIRRRAALAGAALTVVALGVVAIPEAAARVDRLVVALKPDKDPEAMLQERRALQAFLQEKLGQPVDVIVPLSSAVILEGLAGGSIDVAYLPATDMLAARRAGAAEILLAGELAGRTSYASYWLSLAGKPYTKIDDLRGKPIAFASRTSTSGYLVPHADLVRRGLLKQGEDPQVFFGQGNVTYGTGYVSAVERVLSGEAEAAAVSYYVLDEDKHLTPAQRSRLQRIATQGPVPTHVIAIRKDLPSPEKLKVRLALEALDQPAHRKLRDTLFTSKLVPVDEQSHLAGLEEALRLTGKM